MQRGDTFLMGNPGGRRKHLWMVIGDVPHPTGIGVAVNTSTDPRRTKGECPLTIGDHPWITENCAIAFGDAQLSDQARALEKPLFPYGFGLTYELPTARRATGNADGAPASE
jgi:hypothetical protein